MKYRVLFVVIIAALFSINGKMPKGEVIDRPLTWKDFKGKAPKNSSFKASTATITGYKVNSDNTFEVYLLFNPKKSWVSKAFLKKADKEASLGLLKHEQGHYDIARVIGWELEKAMNDFSFDKVKMRYQVDSIYRSFLKKERSIQQQYDDETEHSKVEAVQKKWNTIIEKAIKEKTINI